MTVKSIHKGGVKENIQENQRGIFLVNAVLKIYETALKIQNENKNQGCHTPRNSWKFEILLETPGKMIFFSISHGNLLENHRVTRFCDFCKFCEVSVVLMRKKMVLPRIMSRMGSLITFKRCDSLVNLISVSNRFSDKIKHFLE